MPSISLVMPAYNEEAGLASTVARCQATLQKCTNDYEIVILNDCSKDRTKEIMDQLQKSDPKHIRTLHHEKNQGIAATFEDLYRAATKEYVFLIPGDGEYPPEALERAMPLLKDYDVVVCKRVRKNYTLYRKVISSLFRWCTLIFFGVELYDPGSTKIVKREIYTDVPAYCTSIYVEAERLIYAVKRGYKITYVEIEPEFRKGGVARGAKFSNVWRSGKDVLWVWWRLMVLRKKA